MNKDTTKTFRYTKSDDIKRGDKVDNKIDLSPFLGKWANTKEGSGQLPQVELLEQDGKLILHAYGANNNELIDWGTTECRVFAENTYDGTAIAFIAGYSFGEIDIDITANVKLGVLVVQTYTYFNDGSNRLNYYAREFYGPAQA